MSVAARDGERKRFPLSATRTPRPRSRAPHPAPTRDDSLQSEGVVRMIGRMLGGIQSVHVYAHELHLE
jgi:hypothetical protein